VVALEINSTGIKLMEINKGKVVKWASHYLEPGMFEQEVISEPEALGAVIKQLMNSSDISKKDVIASVSGLFSLSRIVTVSIPVEEEVTQQAVLDAVADVMPLSEEELYIFWQTTGTGKDGKQVLVIGVPRDMLDSEIQALKVVGINPHALDLKAMALARAVNRERALIFNIEPSSFDVVIVVNGVPEVMRTTAWKQTEVPAEEVGEHLASALGLTVSFYDSNNPGSSLDPSTPLFITGQLSGDFNLVENLKARVEYPVEKLAPPLEYPAHLPVSQYAVNIGLALKGLEAAKSKNGGGNAPSLPDMNLLPEGYLPWKPSSRQIQALCAIVVGIALLIPFYQITADAMSKTAEAETRYNIINTKMQQKQLEIKNREPLQIAVQEYQTIIDMGGYFAGDLKVINNAAEEFGVHVESIVHQGGVISVSCSADTYLAFRNYVTALEDSGRFNPIPPPEGYPYIKEGTIKIETKAGGE
jgi:hypothetical protein